MVITMWEKLYRMLLKIHNENRNIDLNNQEISVFIALQILILNIYSTQLYTRGVRFKPGRTLRAQVHAFSYVRVTH